MLYLASAQYNNIKASSPSLKLLAYQEGEHAWQLLDDEQWVEPTQDCSQHIGAWFLVEVSENTQVNRMVDATDWMLEVIKNYLSKGILPEFLTTETERIERWRQNLTIQSQDLGRRALEIEARLHQIQELETQLEKDKDNLDSSQQPRRLDHF